MPASIGDVRELDAIYTTNTGVMENTFGFVCVTNVGGDDLTNLASAFKTAMVKGTSGGLLYVMTPEKSCSKLTVTDVVPGTEASIDYTFPAVVGASAEDPLPPQCAALYTLRTGTKGRSYRGRLYHPGGGEADQSNGQWAGATVTALQTISTQLLAVFGPAGSNGDWRLAIISRSHNKTKRAVPIATQVTSITVSSTIRTQRRRVLGVGS